MKHVPAGEGEAHSFDRPRMWLDGILHGCVLLALSLFLQSAAPTRAFGNGTCSGTCCSASAARFACCSTASASMLRKGVTPEEQKRRQMTQGTHPRVPSDLVASPSHRI